jgi:hypothetical protein
MDVEQEIQNIKARNQKVELDKAWEISWARRLFLSLVIYLIAFIWLLTINDTMPALKAFVPPFGYILSTLSLPLVKSWWAKRHPKKF